jgi:ribosomal protein L30/L7E
MKIISVIKEEEVIKKILKHLGLTKSTHNIG